MRTSLKNMNWELTYLRRNDVQELMKVGFGCSSDSEKTIFGSEN